MNKDVKVHAKVKNVKVNVKVINAEQMQRLTQR